MKSTNKIIAIAVVVIAVVAAAGFWGGILYQKSQTVKPGRNFSVGPGAIESAPTNITRRSGGLQGGFTSGDIITKDDNSITLKLRDGGTRIIFYSGSTQISKQAGGTVDDLVVGSSIMVTGSANSDGSVSAQSISLRPVNSGANPGNGGAPSDANPADGSAPVSNGQPAVSK